MSGRTGRTGVLLVNTGTPDSTSTADVRRYLRAFLSDPRVLDMPAALRWLLVNLVILPTRPRQSAEAYRQIWTDEGSPLLVHSLALRDALQHRLGERFRVALGMRYGRPSIASALDELRGEVDDIEVLPLFPQYSSAAFGSAVEAVLTKAGALWNTPPLRVHPEFYDDAGFLDAFTTLGRACLAASTGDHVLFSFHGLPESQVLRSDEGRAHCLTDGCCDVLEHANRRCYRAQSFETARQLASRLGLAEGTWSVSFQSRLGGGRWIQPYTDEIVTELRERGVERLVVFCPAFVADCLETLEEIGLRLREQWRALGGEDLHLVPSLNAAPEWVEAIARWLEEPGRVDSPGVPACTPD